MTRYRGGSTVGSGIGKGVDKIKVSNFGSIDGIVVCKIEDEGSVSSVGCSSTADGSNSGMAAAEKILHAQKMVREMIVLSKLK